MQLKEELTLIQCGKAMQLEEELTVIQCGNRSILEYLHMVKSLVDEITLIDHLISDNDLTLYFLQGLDPEFREIAAHIQAKEKSLALNSSMIYLLGMRAT